MPKGMTPIGPVKLQNQDHRIDSFVNIQYDDYPDEIDWKFEEYNSNGTSAITTSIAEATT